MKGTEFWTRIQAKALATCASCAGIVHVTTPGTVFDLGSQVVFSGIYFFFGSWVIDRPRDIKVHFDFRFDNSRRI